MQRAASLVRVNSQAIIAGECYTMSTPLIPDCCSSLLEGKKAHMEAYGSICFPPPAGHATWNQDPQPSTNQANTKAPTEVEGRKRNTGQQGPPCLITFSLRSCKGRENSILSPGVHQAVWSPSRFSLCPWCHQDGVCLRISGKIRSKKHTQSQQRAQRYNATWTKN
jgi:hypothetical protein